MCDNIAFGPDEETPIVHLGGRAVYVERNVYKSEIVFAAGESNAVRRSPSNTTVTRHAIFACAGVYMRVRVCGCAA